MRIRWGFTLVLMLVVTLLAPRYTVAEDDARYFPETGHWVTGKFLRFYESVPDPIVVYGYPITDAFQTGSAPQYPGMLVQYFEKVRFEYHPENPPELAVVLSPLGEYMYEVEGPGSESHFSHGLGQCRNIPADGFPVCYNFLTFFDAYGGIAQFGYPISAVEYHDNLMVQYFQRARLEMRNDLPPGERVIVSDLGKQYFDLSESPLLLLPNAEDYIANLLVLKAHAFVNRAVVAQNDSITLLVVVQDQNLQPVPDTQVTIIVRFSNGVENRYIMDLTNEKGFTVLPLDIRDAPYGLAEVIVIASNNLLQTQTLTSFRVW